MNCEGAECVVLDHLDDQGMLRRIDHLLVHFDVEKIPSFAAQAIGTRERLDSADEVRLAAAIGVRQILLELGPRFEADTGHKIVSTFESNGALVQQARLDQTRWIDVAEIH